ncbi:MAG TPA: hypothetical protein VMB91_02750 [Solirubrobacteraceae bacterium]|nr:hypothetical protein [Solirubrobacteraceae bacterium]
MVLSTYDRAIIYRSFPHRHAGVYFRAPGGVHGTEWCPGGPQLS